MTQDDLTHALAWARRWLDGYPAEETDEVGIDAVCRALLAEYERAEANAADARRWRAVKPLFECKVISWGGGPAPSGHRNYWYIMEIAGGGGETVDEAADRLVAEQEK